ncbi:hypothetical protein A3K93_12960 [Acinetobacter sp. NCu2D-2]|uniref:TetR family transcriptional regulator n=1 Tax=Acinetobacter sp. NCu2D-2 TaxID=1608473 RepID=UPI0007CD9F5C|nr:TetR family transcriptional regulator [Acinetobacter sp. NCu2D-2]ANF83007.1 hypothetical protein A3K93_12960 [Acinetobacter sp. NCu2D-2]
MSVREEKKHQTRQALMQAALQLSYEKGSFSNISLRELTLAVDLVPSAFYRHFPSLEQLCLELIDHVSHQIRNVCHCIGKMIMERPEIQREERIGYFFKMVEKYPEYWHFFIAEYLTGNAQSRKALHREYDFLLQDMIERLADINDFKNVKDPEKAESFAEFFLQSLMAWAKDYLAILQQDIATQEYKKQMLKQRILKRVAFLHAAL